MYFKSGEFNDADFSIKGIFSTGTEDRHGEVVDQAGWKLEEYMQNPVVLFSHDPYQPAIGKMVELGMNESGNLAGTIQFAANEYEFAKTIYNLYKGGFMRAFSVGFMNHRYEIDQENDMVILRENTLYEVSAVNIPANAMALAIQKGIDCEPIAKLNRGEYKMQITEKEPEKVEDPVEILSKSDETTIRAAIGKLNVVLSADAKADTQGGEQGREPLDVKDQGGKKKVTFKLLNQAIRELVRVKKNL